MAGRGATEFARTVITGTPVLTLDCTVIEPPKMLCVAVPSAATPIASVSTPLPILNASRAAISLFSAVDDTSTAAGDAWLDGCRQRLCLGRDQVTLEIVALGDVHLGRAVLGQAVLECRGGAGRADDDRARLTERRALPSAVPVSTS